MSVEFFDDGLEELAQEIARENGLDLRTSWLYAACIGDTPCTDTETGRVLVIDKQTGKQLALVKVPSLTEDAGEDDEV